MPGHPRLILPRIYVILDAEVLARREIDLVTAALELTDAGVRLVQYRDKRGDVASVLKESGRLARCLEGSGCRLILNDYADLVEACGAGGVHVGQDDMSVARARELIGPGKILGVSTHSDAQLLSARDSVVDYVAIGPVFSTSTKVDAEPVVGVDGVRRARELTTKPLVAIGGISLLNARMVLEAGADSVAVISAVLGGASGIGSAARELIRATSDQDVRRRTAEV